MTSYPTQAHYPDTEPISPCPILKLPSAWLGSDKYKCLHHWFDSPKVPTNNLSHRKWALNWFSPHNVKRKLRKSWPCAWPDRQNADSWCTFPKYNYINLLKSTRLTAWLDGKDLLALIKIKNYHRNTHSKYGRSWILDCLQSTDSIVGFLCV